MVEWWVSRRPAKLREGDSDAPMDWNRYWNCNDAPRVKVKAPNDPKSRAALVRRINVVEYFATFTANAADVNFDNLVFPDDPELKALWSSPLGRFILWTDHWIPFMTKTSLEDARKMLSCPSEH